MARVRRSVGVATALTLVAGLAALGWLGWFPRWRPTTKTSERFGVDVSAHQGTIDWRKVRGDGITVAYIKATEGSDFVDARFTENWHGARDAGLLVGAYHFFTLCSPGALQAQNFAARVGADAAVLAPAIDLELAGNCSARPSIDVVRTEVAAFVADVRAAWGRDPVIYERGDFRSRYPDVGTDQLPAWKHRFVLRPSLPWVVWQVSSFARIHGIEGRVDLDVAVVPDF